MAEPLFSVIICTYGRPQLLTDAIGSVLAQTKPDLECIVVDDASPHPLDVPTDPRIRVLRRDSNGGAPAARNSGLETARGRYVTFLDDDDLFTPDRLEIALEGLARAPLSLCWRSPLERNSHSRSWTRWLEGDVHDVIIPNSPGMVFAVERSAIPRFDERFLVKDDVDWWIRATGKLTVATVPRVGYLVREHAGPQRTKKGRASRLADRLLLLDTHRQYFAERPRLAAHLWKRIAADAYRLGDSALARRADIRAIRLHPDREALGLMLRIVATRGREQPLAHRRA